MVTLIKLANNNGLIVKIVQCQLAGLDNDDSTFISSHYSYSDQLNSISFSHMHVYIRVIKHKGIHTQV